MKRIALFMTVALSACGGSTIPSAEPTNTPQESSVCEELAMLCHEHDKTSAVAHECHVLGHSRESTEASCLAKRPACVEACGASEPPAGEQQPGGKESTAADAVPAQVPPGHDHSTHQH
jgi:hypothetical protein